MLEKLIFTFAFSLSLALDHSLVAQPTIIWFEMGFDSFRIIVRNNSILVVPIYEVPKDREPIIYFDIHDDFDLPSLKKKAYMTLIILPRTIIIIARSFIAPLLPTPLTMQPLRWPMIECFQWHTIVLSLAFWGKLF